MGSRVAVLLQPGAAWVVLCLLGMGSVSAGANPGAPPDVCVDLRMREAVTHDCAFFETPDVDFSPGEPGWNAIWAHRMTDPPRSRFEVTFELKQVTGDLLLTAAHLTASTVENGVQIGYAPISLVVNDDDGDPFNGTHLALHMGPDGNSPADGFDVGYNHDDRHGLETDTFLLPAQHLRAGTNTVTWAFGAEARSSYRLQALRIYAPSRGRLQFTSEAYRVDEAGRMAVLRVLRQDSWEGEVSARFQVRAITAAPGSDYEDVSGTVTFRHQEQSQTIVIPIQADSESEGPETFEVCLSDPGPGCVLGHPATTVVTVMDEQTRASALHVDRDSPVDGNGLDWKTAFHDLQDALREARRACVAHREIWVAGGTYTPDGGSLDPGASFQLVDGVALYGGFQGNETRRSQRDPLLHPTILSGDLNGDDGPGFTNTSDNAHHVVRAADVGATSILDGFVVQGGYGTTLYGEYTSTGGGLFLRHASPVIRNCTIRWNRAMDGAGAFCHGLSFPAFEACRFEGNLVDVPITGGAGLSNRTSSPLLLNCVFLGNRCLGTGGALCNWDSSPTVLQCTFSWNTAMEYTGRGGSVFVFGAAFDTRPVLRNCILTSNFANEGNQFGFMGTASLFIEHSILEDIGSLSWIEMYRQAGLVKGPGVEDRDVQLTPDGRLISRVDALGGVACDPAATDIDGEVRSAGQATLGADVFLDADRDGLPDAWEKRWFGDALAGDPYADADGDGLSNLDEFQLHGSNPWRRPLFVDGARGDDSYDGSADRPKRTIRSGLDAAQPGDTVLLAPGTYQGPGNTGIEFQGRKVVLRGAGQSPEATVMDCNYAGFAFRFTDGETPASALANLSILHGRTEVGGVVQCHAASPLFKDCRIIDSVCALRPQTLTLQGGQGYDFSEQVFTPATLGDVYYDAGWFMMDGDHWEILDMGPLPLTELGRLPGVWDYEAWGMGAWDTNGLKAVAGRSYAIRTWEYERYALVHVLEAHADRITVEWLYVNAKSWPGEYRTGGLSVYLGVPRLAGFTLQGSGPDGLYVQSGGLSLVGDLRLFSNGLRTDWAVIQGTGRIVLDANTTWRADRVFLRCDVTGPGTLTVMDGSEFRIEHRAAVSLSEGDLKGSIECDGLLLLKDQVLLRDTLIRVNRLDSQDEACLDNCVIQAEAGAPYGQFFVSGQAAVNVPAIRANGDRYLDVDPKVYDCNNLRVGVIDVLVDEGVHGTMGGLFELRGLDIPNLPWEPNVYVHPLTKVPDFGPQTWTIDRLELVPGARLNLTNRFDFQAPFDWAGGQEVLFVKDLVLGEGAILNTAFNRVYCERLIQADSARIISIPLLGFSLNNIAFDDERDFSTRVKTHNTIATDLGMSDVFVSRVVGQSPDPRGMMRMRNLPIDGTSVHALAQGLFAKAGEDTILVRFEYLFETSSGQLAVYLTDSTEMLESDHPERENHYSLVGQVLTPPAGRPGSAGSGTFATFEMRAAAGRLDFYRGVRIELELVGPAGTSVLIDNWDPLAQPNPHYCWDLVQPNDTVDAFDFLAVMSESGKRSEEVQSVSGVPMGHYLEGFFCRDGYVTVLDAMAANWHMCGLGCPANDPIGALAVSGLSEGGVQAEGDSTGDAPICPGGSLLAVGKTYSVDLQGSDDFLQEALYGLDAAGAATPCGGVSGMGQMNIRLVKGPEGEVYAVNLERGLVKVGGVQPLIRTRVCSVDCEPRTQGPATVYVGMQGVGGTVAGLPILDAAFDESGDLYVVPVVVSPEGTDAYVAGARLRQGGGGWSVVQLYAPQTQANDNIVLDNLREIETDCRGRVLVLNVARQNRSDAVLVFDRDTGLEAGREDVAGLGMESPGAMRLVGGGGVLVLGGASSGKACVVAVSVGDLGQSGPHGRLFEVVGMDQVTGLAEDPGTGAVWVTGIVLEDVPAAFDSTTMLDVLNRPPFYSGCVASLMVDQQTPVEARPVVSGGERTLSLPLAVEWFDPLR